MINFVVLYLVTELLGIWYMTSVIIAFVFSFFTSFVLQKLWTFNNKDFSTIHIQTAKLFTITLVSLGINMIGIYLLVSKFDVWYIFAQALILGLIAAGNFFTYKHLVFV